MKPYYQNNRITLYKGDAVEIMPELQQSFDLVCADPPYHMALASNAKMAGWGDMMNSAFWYAHLLKEFHRLTINRSGAVWMFNSWRGFSVLQKAAYDAEWPLESLLVWDKQWIGPGGTRGLRPSYELVGLFRQEGFSIPDRSIPDIWQHQYSSQRPTGHPAEKPLSLFIRLIDVCGPQVERILDPFSGSGTALLAAKKLGKEAVGIEIEEKYCEMIATRLQQGDLPFP